MARLKRRCPWSGVQFGSNDGVPAITRTAPVLTSIATTAPLRPAERLRSATCWAFGSSVVCRSSPTCVLRAERVERAAPSSVLAAGQLRRCSSCSSPARPKRRSRSRRGARTACPVGIAARRSGLPDERAVAGQHRAVGGADDAALDPLLLEQHAAVVRVLAQRLGLEHRPARREADEHGEQHDERARRGGRSARSPQPPSPAPPAGARGRRPAAAAPAARSWRRSRSRRRRRTAASRRSAGSRA